MKKDSIVASLIPNIFELEEPPFLKQESIQWRRFKDKEKFLPIFRNITYQTRTIMSKIFIFDIREEVKDKKIKRELLIFTEKEIITLQQLYQILNENMQQKDFSEEVKRLKQFENNVKKYVEMILSRSYITYKKNEDFLVFNVYKSGEQYYVKASFSNYNYRFELTEPCQSKEIPQPLLISNLLVKQELNKKFNQNLSMANSIKVSEGLIKLYKNFYDMTYFHYDQFLLKLQVFHNYPLLRLKNYVPIRFIDFKTQHPLEGPIFSNSDPECMYEHFVGFNADTTKNLEGGACAICQLPYDQFQQNQLMMMLRDNICNPEKSNVFYCPQFNRFKILKKTLQPKQTEQGQIIEQPIYQTTITYLNYYHFRLNLKKIINKNRLTFYVNSPEENIPLSFFLNNRELLIMDPARGKYCQHYAFTDLRLYYQGYDPLTRLYKCPVVGCNETMPDGDIVYLKEIQIILQFANFKCEKSPDLVTSSKVIIDHREKKVHLVYKAREENSVVALSKIDELPQFYKTLVDPYIPFAQYSLGIKDKQRQEKMNEYMFGGWRGESEQQIEEEEEEIDDD